MRVKSCLLLVRLGDERWRVAYARCKISEPVDVVSIAGRVACADNLVGLWDMPRAQIRLASWRARIPCHRWASANVPRGTPLDSFTCGCAAESESTTYLYLDGAL